MTPLTEAAERLRRNPTWGENPQYESDLLVLATEYLRLTDPTPVDQDWLLAVGFVEQQNGTLAAETERVPDMRWHPTHQLWEIGGKIPSLEWGRTRGQVRMLCHLLGVELRGE